MYSPILARDTFEEQEKQLADRKEVVLSEMQQTLLSLEKTFKVNSGTNLDDSNSLNPDSHGQPTPLNPNS